MNEQVDPQGQAEPSIFMLTDEILELLKIQSDNVDSAVFEQEKGIVNARKLAQTTKEQLLESRISLLRMEIETLKRENTYHTALLEIAYAEDAQHQYKAQRAGYRQGVLQMWKIHNGHQDRSVQFGENNSIIVK